MKWVKSKYLKEYPEWNQTIKEEIQRAGEILEQKFESEGTLKEVEHEPRSGFIPFQEGGWEYKIFIPLIKYFGTGMEFSNDVANNKVQEMIDYNQEIAMKEIKQKYSKELENISDDKINYTDLYEMGLGDIAEELSDLESDFIYEDSIMIMVRCFFEEENNNFYVVSVINWESPYFRQGASNEVFMEDEFTAIEGEDIRSKLRKSLDYVMKIF